MTSATSEMAATQSGTLPVQELSPHWRNPFLLGCKWLFDVLVAGSLLVVLSPVFLILVLAVKLTSTGPAFYRWNVVGKAGRPFAAYKFRSMCVNADELKAE